MTHPAALSVEEFDELIENHEALVIVDVREAHAHARARIPGSIHVPVAQLREKSIGAVAAPDPLATAGEKTLVLYCDDGQLSEPAGLLLQAAGNERVYWLAGGLRAWQHAGQAIIAD